MPSRNQVSWSKGRTRRNWFNHTPISYGRRSQMKTLHLFRQRIGIFNCESSIRRIVSYFLNLSRVHIESTGVETYVTSGPGPEKEVMGLFFKSQFDNAAGLLTNVIDDYTMLATVPMSSALDISPTKKDDLTLFGSAVGLSLVHGNYPAKLNPLLLAYLLNDCSLSSISKSSVLEFFPTLHQTLTRWLALDYHDNSTLSSFAPHFAIYHNLPVCVSSFNIVVVRTHALQGIGFIRSLWKSPPFTRLDYVTQCHYRTRDCWSPLLQSLLEGPPSTMWDIGFESFWCMCICSNMWFNGNSNWI